LIRLALEPDEVERARQHGVELARVALDRRQDLALLAGARPVRVVDQQLRVAEHHVQRLSQVV
jgi:hypothetical protein